MTLEYWLGRNGYSLTVSELPLEAAAGKPQGLHCKTLFSLQRLGLFAVVVNGNQGVIRARFSHTGALLSFSKVFLVFLVNIGRIVLINLVAKTFGLTWLLVA